MLRLIGAEIEEKPCEYDWMSIPFAVAPKILFEPGFALTLQDLKERFTGRLKISADSTIILGAKAAERSFGHLTIDGTLVAYEPVNFFEHFREYTVKWQPATAEDNEALRIRGYKVLKVKQE